MDPFHQTLPGASTGSPGFHAIASGCLRDVMTPFHQTSR